MDGNQQDILQNAPASVPSHKDKKRGRVVSILLAIFLFVALVTFGEKLIYDLNKNVNPYTCPVYTTSQTSYDYGRARTSIDREEALETCGKYKIGRLFLILAIVVPVLIGTFFLFLKYGFRGGGGKYMPLATAYFAFSSWLLGHLLIETAHFLIRRFQSLWIYVIFFIEIAILTAFVIIIQKRRRETDDSADV